MTRPCNCPSRDARECIVERLDLDPSNQDDEDRECKCACHWHDSEYQDWENARPEVVRERHAR